MKLPAVLRFELAYQLRRPWPWLCAAVLTVFAMLFTRIAVVPVTLPEDFILNSPFVITTVTVFACQIWLLIAPVIAGEAGARDVYTGMHPLVYTASLTRAEYLGGRFLAAFLLNAMILLGVQLGSLLAVYATGIDESMVGPFRPGAYAVAWGVALTTAFVATAIQFAAALHSGRPMASYVGSLALFFLSYPVTMLLWFVIGYPALLLDPIGVLSIMNEMMSSWTIVEKNVRAFTLDGAMLANRLLWLGVASLVLAVAYGRFRFVHRTQFDPFARFRRRTDVRVRRDDPAGAGRLGAPAVTPSFDFATRLRQVMAIGHSSFRMISTSPAGLFLLLVYPAFIALVLYVDSVQWGITLQPRTGYILSKHVTATLTHFSDYRVMVPLLIIFLAGELVWRERDARMHENVDATSVSDSALLLGKLLGLALALCTLMLALTAAGMIAQMMLGYRTFEIGLYLRILFGLQLPEYLLMAALAMLIHTLVNQKYAGHLIGLVALLLIFFAPTLRIEHNLLVFGGGPSWSFTDIRGFGDTLGPWLWFRLYWAAWAILLLVAARLLWVRGRDTGAGKRLRVARLRLGRGAGAAAALAATLIASTGGFIFYNTNVLNEHVTSREQVRRLAQYELRYGQYEGIPQPVRSATSLRVEIHPGRNAADIRGTYVLVNRHDRPIDSVHVEPASKTETTIAFDRAARRVVADGEVRHHIYALEEPLRPGDSMVMTFDVHIRRRGFTNQGANDAVIDNGSYFTSNALPDIGYQPTRELWGAEDRRRHGLPRQVTLPPPTDIDPALAAIPPYTFEAIVGTSADQIAVAPGELRRTWTDRGRRYFHYASDVPINGLEVFFSARYLLHRERWRDVDVQIYLHPDHATHLGRVRRAVRASLDYYSEQFGPYPFRFLQVVEQPGNFFGMGVDGGGVVTGGEGFFLLDPQGDGFDAMFEIIAHEMGHQWWGVQLKPAFAEGAGVISEGLAWYSGMQLVKHTKGREALRRFMYFMRQPNPWPQIRTGLPLLRAMDPWANYRKAPYVMHALSEYIGEDRVNGALRTLIAAKETSLVTTIDMYRALQEAAPDSMHLLLRDLFELNTFWSFDTKSAVAQQAADGSWQVTLQVHASKTVADSTSAERELPMNEWVEVGVFAPPPPGAVIGAPLYLQRHRITSGLQTITITVPGRPAHAGVDPYSLLDWAEGDNLEPVDIEK